jgi:quercetin dioxygenase-like cupin family protein
VSKSDPTPDEHSLTEHKNDVGRSEWQMTHTSDTLAAPVLQFDLDVERKKLLAQPAYEKSGQASTTLVKEADFRVVLICLRTTGRMEKHKSSGPVSIQPIDGRLRLVLPDRTSVLTFGDLLVLESGIVHDVEAIEDTTFLLTIGRTMYPVNTPDHDDR